VNNWDLVDVSCREVVGGYLLAIHDWEPLAGLARSELIWERRIAIVSTWTFTRAGNLAPCFAISRQLLSDSEDLIHKAVGWMLREAGKKDEAALVEFLDANAPQMPRTSLRYATERMTPVQRKHWRSGKRT
jgi:3-methyladenine DNA glycosylase AlkD